MLVMMGTRWNSFGLILTFNLLIALWPTSASKLRLTNFVCDLADKSLMAVHLCRLKAVRRNWTILNFNGTLLKTINNGKIHGQMFKRANGFKPWLYNITIDGCRFARKQYIPVAALVYNLFKENSNLNHHCPYAGPVYVMGLHIFGEQVPVPLPSGEYLIMLKWYLSVNKQYSKDPTLSTGIYFSFEEN